jgi:hypothetical protein
VCSCFIPEAFSKKEVKMELERYEVVSDRNREVYEFLSTGPNGTIKKAVHFNKVRTNLFNLSFGDWDERSRHLDDRARSNNRDREKILATVASTVVDFMAYHPHAILFARGSTQARTRLYQMGISGNWNEISQLFIIEGYYNDAWEPFSKERNYQAFSLRAK